MRGPALNPGLTWERVNPCLLDRLLGGEGILPSGANLGGDQPFITLRAYSESVRRDLDWLVQSRAPLPETVLEEDPAGQGGPPNAGAAAPARTLEEFPETRSSVLCFGLPDLTGRITVTDQELQGLLVQAMEDFEPRLDSESLQIQRVAKKGDGLGLEGSGPGGDGESHLRRVFAVVADLWAQPRMERVDYVAEFDSVTGPRVTSI